VNRTGILTWKSLWLTKHHATKTVKITIWLWNIWNKEEFPQQWKEFVTVR